MISYFKALEIAMKLPSLEEFIESPSRNSYIKYKNLEAYYKKGIVSVNGKIYRNVLIRGNTINKRRSNNFKIKANPRSTGQYKELDSS